MDRNVEKLSIIDFERKGNVVKFYLGRWGVDFEGPDWDILPYQNSSLVCQKYIIATMVKTFDFDDIVVCPSDGNNNVYTKMELKDKKIPFLCVLKSTDYNPEEVGLYENNYENVINSPNVIKYCLYDTIDTRKEAVTFLHYRHPMFLHVSYNVKYINEDVLLAALHILSAKVRTMYKNRTPLNETICPFDAMYIKTLYFNCYSIIFDGKAVPLGYAKINDSLTCGIINEKCYIPQMEDKKHILIRLDYLDGNDVGTIDTMD